MSSFFRADGLGSLNRPTNEVVAATLSRRYDACGSAGRLDPPSYAYTGREWDPETGLYYYRARYYDPKVGRFISEDPIGFRGGVNFYAYVRNRPADLADPTGLDSFLCESPIQMSPAGRSVGQHEYLCVEKDGKRTCQGLVPSGPNILFTPGAWDQSDDAEKSSCRKVSKTSCQDRCIENAFKASPPMYSIFWTQCQVWARETFYDCYRRCQAQGQPLGGPSY